MRFDQGYALVIGVGADLPMTVTDAQGVHGLLTDPTRCAYPPDQARLLTGPAASRDGMLAALDTLAAQVAGRPQATVVVYFSGHGVQVEPAGPAHHHLLTYGYNLGRLDATTIAGDELADRLAALAVQKLVVILDCCHAGGFEHTKAPGDATLVETHLPLDHNRVLAAGSGRVILASSEANEKSLAGAPYSVFTQALLEGLAGAGSERRDGYAGVLDVFDYVAKVVPRRTEGRQNPVMQANNLRGNFALAYYAAGDKAPRPLDWMQQPPSPAPSPLTPSQRRHWETQLGEQQARYDTLSKRIAAIDVDVGRALDSLRRQVLDESRQDLLDEREQVAEQMAEIERRLGR